MKKTMRTDTGDAALEQQVRLMRAAGSAGRFAAACSLSRIARTLSRRALCRQMPEADDREVDLAFIRLHYGDELALRARKAILDER